jgi:hypothetical protein
VAAEFLPCELCVDGLQVLLFSHHAQLETSTTHATKHQKRTKAAVIGNRMHVDDEHSHSTRQPAPLRGESGKERTKILNRRMQMQESTKAT